MERHRRLGGTQFSRRPCLRGISPLPARAGSIESDVNIDFAGRSDQYVLEILPTRARKDVLATHHNGVPMTVDTARRYARSRR